MGLVSQVIKNLKGGISQQPDILRYSEQGAQQINGWSSETEGLQKRPPLVFLKALSAKGGLGTNPNIHLINRDENEQYYAVFTGKTIRVFDLAGNEKTVRWVAPVDYIYNDNPRDKLRMITVADYTFVVNKDATVRAGSSKSPNVTNDALINVRGGQYGRTLTVTINGTLGATLALPQGDQPADVKATDAQTIANNLAGQLRTKFGTSWTFTVGQGYIWIRAPAGTTINTVETTDGYADQLINPVTHYVQSFSKLPINAPNGYSVQIVGDTSRTSDKYYVTYNSSRRVWVESAGWNLTTDFNASTMPHALVRAADGAFEFRAIDWTKRNCGDDDTNPYPSFVDSQINDVFFFRNRLGFLSGENIILSRTSKYFSFFPPSVANLSDDDPIDVAVSFNRVSILKYAVPFTEELLLWSDEAQFVLSANGILSARSVELDLTTQFDVQDRARPYGIGRNVYFASPRASYTSINRYYAVQDVSSVKNAEDITAHVPSYIPNGVFNIHGSSTENFASILTSGAESKVFIYKFLYLNEELRQQSWSHWDFGEGTRVLAASSIGSTMVLVLENAYNVWIAYAEFIKNSMDLAGEPYRLYVDNKKPYVIPAGTYNDDTYTTTLNLTTIYGMSYSQGKVFVAETDGSTTVHEPLGRNWTTNPQIVLNGNMEGKTVFIGFSIPFTYQFSKLLIKQNADDGTMSTEDSGRLQLRRMWVNYEKSGAFTVTTRSPGREFTYEMAGGRLNDSALRLGTINLGTGQFRFPTQGNAKLLDVFITSENTTPLNVIGCGWEGNYQRRTSGI